MSLIFKYIVFLFLTFNTCSLNAAEVIFAPDESDEFADLKVPDFIESGNLPHPVQMREILLRKDNSPLGRLMLLGQYFDARYSDDALNVDFREDVALMFPEMPPEEVERTTTYIKAAIRIYRFSKAKIEEIKQEKLAPSDPPLIVDDDDYALLGDREYIATKEDEVAIISDFKKVIGYGSNPREIEAMETYVERLRSENKTQTDYEHFRSMLKKIDWHELTSYGVTRPSPFVGNAGIGPFEEKDGFKARLIADTARIGDSHQMILGLHVDIPNHLFMLATNLNDELKKPKIEVVDSRNIASYELLYPMPLQAVSSDMIGVYRGNFAFPIKVMLAEKNKPAYFKVNLSFESCDSSFECQNIVLPLNLNIDAKVAGKPVLSSMSNFIHQSFYNLPKELHKNLILEDVSYTFDEKGNVSKLNFDFKYHTRIKNFAFFLENEANTIFEAPEVIVEKEHIYVQTKPLERAENILTQPLVWQARLNDFVAVKQNILYEKSAQNASRYTFLQLLLRGFAAGVLFYLTFWGFALSYICFLIKKNFRTAVEFALSKGTVLCLLLGLCGFQIARQNAFLYDLFEPNVFVLSLAFLSLAALLFDMRVRLYEKITHPIVFGSVVAALIVLLICACGMPYGEKVFLAFDVENRYGRAILFMGVVLGLMLPDLCALYLRNRQISPKFVELFLALAKSFVVLALVILLARLMLPLSFKSLMRCLLVLLAALFVLNYLFLFAAALYRTDLKPVHISGAKRVVCVLILGFVLLFSHILQKVVTVKEIEVNNLNLTEILNRAQNGENLIVAFEYPSCLVCKYNDLTLFNQSLIKTLKEEYKVSYISQNIQKSDSSTVEFLKKYKRFARPLYVLYTPLAPNGVVLPNMLTLSDLDRVFETFRIYPSSSKSAAEKRRKTNLR